MRLLVTLLARDNTTMAKNPASNAKNDQPVANVRLLSTFFGLHRHRPAMGLIARRATMLTIIILVSLGTHNLRNWVHGTYTGADRYGIDIAMGILALLGLWFSYRIVHWYKFAEFLIAVQNEMAKVSWPKKPELINSSIVVILTMFLFTLVLFIYDLVWQALLTSVGVMPGVTD